MIRNLIRTVTNIPGWRTKRKIVVIESDDWGSIRMPSQETFHWLEAKGVDLRGGGCERYNLFDSLAIPDDFSALFDVLKKHRDANGRNPVFTAVSVVANPDFEKIAASNFLIYHYEPFTTTLLRSRTTEKSFEMWKEGMRNGLFVPQFHGREHLNVAVWLRHLQVDDVATRLAFERHCWGFNNSNQFNISFQAAFEVEKVDEISQHKEIILDGLNLFKNIFGFRASFFVPPNGPINNAALDCTKDAGIEFVSTSKLQLESLGEGRHKRRLHYLGQKNVFGQFYLTRNCSFEPSDPGCDWVASCLAEMRVAFLIGKPAVISSHRINYVGALSEKNRSDGLIELNRLLSAIVQQWPDVEFMTSSELGKIVKMK